MTAQHDHDSHMQGVRSDMYTDGTSQVKCRRGTDRPPGRALLLQLLCSSLVYHCHLSYSLGAVQLSQARLRPLRASHPALHFHQVAGLLRGIAAAAGSGLTHNLVCQ